MPESWSSRLLRWKFNLFPAYRGTGARIAYIADDFHEVRLRLPLSWRTRNAVGTIFGGSMYGAVDLAGDDAVQCRQHRPEHPERVTGFVRVGAMAAAGGDPGAERIDGGLRWAIA